jgi:hypothetical protein
LHLYAAARLLPRLFFIQQDTFQASALRSSVIHYCEQADYPKQAFQESKPDHYG